MKASQSTDSMNLYPIAKEILKNMDSLEKEAGRLAILERSQLHIVCIPIKTYQKPIIKKFIKHIASS